MSFKTVELSGENTSQGVRYDPVLGKFMGVDIMAEKYSNWCHASARLYLKKRTGSSVRLDRFFFWAEAYF